MKCVGIIGTLDTKAEEALFFKAAIEACGLETLVIDCSIGLEDPQPYRGDIPREQLMSAGDIQKDRVAEYTKADLLDKMKIGAAEVTKTLFRQKRIDALGAIGGMQNTFIATAAMQVLPVGIPKLICSTILSGQQSCASITGGKDILMMPAIADVMGINDVTRVQLSNAAAALAGMTKYAGGTVKKTRTTVGLLTNGVTSRGATVVSRLLDNAGVDAISFHTSGLGWKQLEEMIQEGVIDAVLCYSLIELTCNDLLHSGYAQGSKDVLKTAADRGIPILATTGSLDFIDYPATDFKARQEDLSGRPYLKHNSGIVHVKLSQAEGHAVGALLSERLNASKGPVSVMIPAKGFRSDTGPGEPLYSPMVDKQVMDGLLSGLRKTIGVTIMDCNINDPEFSKAAAAKLLKLMNKY